MGRFQWVPKTSVSVNVRHFLESTIYFSDILVRVWEINKYAKFDPNTGYLIRFKSSEHFH